MQPASIVVMRTQGDNVRVKVISGIGQVVCLVDTP